MPLTKLQFRPGINRDLTSYTNEGGWRDCDKVRFRLGYPEKIGGWEKYSSSTYLGTARSLHNWVALDGANYLGIGTNLKYYIEEGQSFNDITPIRSTTSLGEVTFAATNGSSIITVTDANNGSNQGDFVTFRGAQGLGGNITAPLLNKEHQITGVVDSNSYEITVSATANSSDTGAGGDGVGTVTSAGTAVASTGIGTASKAAIGTGLGLVSFLNPSGTGIGTFTISGASTGSDTTTAVVQTSSSGTGTSAEFTVVASSGDYTVTATSLGSGYAVGDTILIEGQNIGGVKETNDLTLTITGLQGSSVGEASHTGEAQTATSGSGSGAAFTVGTDGEGGYSVLITTVGSGYAVGDTVTIAGTGIGGSSPANDLVLTVVRLSASSADTTAELYNDVDQSATSGSGSGAKFTVISDGLGNYTVAVTTIGSGYAINDTVTIAGTSLNGTSPANDIVLTVTGLTSVTYSNVTQSATSGSGSGASFDITRNGSGAYIVDSVVLIGLGYAINDTITIPGASLGGATPGNNCTITVASLSHPTIADYQLNVGLDTTVGGVGWGAGLWGGTTNAALSTTTAGAINNSQITTAAEAIDNSETSIDVTSATGIVAGNVILIGTELILVGGVSTNTLTGCTRGHSGTVAAAHDNGATVSLIVSIDIDVTSATGIVAGDTILIDQELILVGGVSTNTLTGCSRAQSGTVAASHVSGSVVSLAVGNEEVDNDFFGWGIAASGGLTTEVELRTYSQDNFGEDLIINPRNAGLFYWDRTTGTSSRAVALNTKAGTKTSIPTIAKQVLVSDQDRHVIAFGADPIGGVNDINGTGVQDPLLIRFADQEDPLQWYPLATNTAGDLRLGAGSTFIQAVETKREILVWTDTALHSMRFIGPPFTFGIQQLASGITIASANAAAASEDFVFWMGIDSFFVYAGQTAQLPCTVKNKVFGDFNLSQIQKVTSGINSEFSEVTWFYPSADSEENNKYVTYNYLEKVWTFGSLARTAWLDRGTRTYPLSTGGGYLYNHELGYDDDGAPMNSFIESASMDIGDGDHFSYIRRLVPDLTFTGSTALSSPQATFTLKARNFPGANFNNTSSSDAIRTQESPVEEYTDQLFLRVRGRSFALRVESEALGSKWKLGSPRIDLRQDGRR